MEQDKSIPEHLHIPNEKSKCLHVTETRMYVSLAPRYTGRPYEGIRAQHLDPLIMTYFHPVQGVVLAHDNLRLLGQSDDEQEVSGRAMAKIMYDSPMSFLWVTTRMLVWRPRPGDYLQGYINLQSPGHIGLLVHDIFNATIKRESIPTNWSFVYNQEDEDMSGDEINANEIHTVTGHTGHRSLGYWVDGMSQRIDGSPITFVVVGLSVSSRLVLVQGSLEPKQS